MAMHSDFGQDCEIRLMVDSSAAIGIAYRQGLGKVRHLDVQQLWVQQKVLSKALKLINVMGAANVADMMTKHVSRDAVEAICGLLGFSLAEGRPEIAPKMSRGSESV